MKANPLARSDGWTARTLEAARCRVSSNDRRSLALAVTTGGLSTTALWVAVARTSAWAIFVLVAVGSVLGAIALVVVGQLLRGRSDLPMVAAVLALVGSGLTVVAIAQSWGWLAATGLLLIIFAILAGYELLAHRTDADPRGALGAGLIVLMLSLVAIVRSSETGTLIGVTAWVIGLVLFKLGVPAVLRAVPRSAPDWNEQVARRGMHALVAGIAVTVAGIALIGIEPLRSLVGNGPAVFAVAFTMAVAGLSVVGIASLHVLPDDTWNAGPPKPGSPPVTVSNVWVVVLIAGITLAAGAWAWTGLHILPGWSALLVVVCGVPLAAGAFFVFRGEGLVFLVMFGFLLVWVLAGRTSEPDQVDPATSDGIVVVLGDSFSSGQGAHEFLPFTNTEGDEGNSCRRSPRSFAQLVGLQLNRTVANYACSGAVTADVHLGPQKPNGETAKAPGGLAQLDSLGDSRYPTQVADVDLVLISIGGNDVDFATVVTACVLPSDCDTAQAQWRARVELIGDDLRATYEAIRALPDLRAEVPIVVVPYPNYVGIDPCDRSLTADELQFAARFVGDINAAIADAVATSTADNLHYFDALDRAYAGRRLCDSPRAANFIQLIPPEGPIQKRLNPTRWHEGTMHPNELGHECTAVALLAWIEPELPELAPTVAPRAAPPSCDLGPASPPPTRSDPSDLMFTEVDGIRCVKGTDEISDDRGCFDGGEWVSLRLKDTARQLALPLALLLLGGALTALGLTRIRIGLVRPLLVDPPSATPATRAQRSPRLYR